MGSALTRWRRHRQFADGMWRWRWFGVAVAYFLNTTNLPGYESYTVQVFIPGFSIYLNFTHHEIDPDAYHTYLDKDAGEVKDARVESPALAAHMDRYRKQRTIDWRVMGRFPWKYQSIDMKHEWRVSL